jgi:hypothetical protein
VAPYFFDRFIFAGISSSSTTGCDFDSDHGLHEHSRGSGYTPWVIRKVDNMDANGIQHHHSSIIVMFQSFSSQTSILKLFNVFYSKINGRRSSGESNTLIN